MDRSGMDAERGRAVTPNRRVGKLAVVVAVQNVLVVVCLLLTFYVYQNCQARGDTDTDIVHIRFSSIKVTSGDNKLKFLEVGSSYMMDLSEQRDQISIHCTGFYMWHVHACYSSLVQELAGTLQLQVAGSDAPVSSFPLNATREVCRVLHSVVYLRRDQMASVHSSTQHGFKINNMTVGLSYLQGTKCAY